MTNRIDVTKLASAYRRLVLWFGAQLVVSFASVALPPLLRTETANLLLSLALLAGTLAIIVALAFYGYQTATALGSDVGWLWSVAMFVPCVNVITLLVLSSKATKACRANGIPVGFFGPKVTEGKGASGDASG